MSKNKRQRSKRKRRRFLPVSKEKYASELKTPRWQKRRLKVFERDGWRCQKCGSTRKTLVVHHLKYTQPLPWQEPLKNLITWCEDCHKSFHKYKS